MTARDNLWVLERQQTRTSDPASEPLTAAEAKSHLRVDVTDDDTLIGNLIQAAREYIEDVTRRALITQTWQLKLSRWPESNRIKLPRPPLQSVSSITYLDTDGTNNTFSSTLYRVETVAEPGEVYLNYGESWPSATLEHGYPITITLVAGYGDAASDVPQWVKQAMLMLIGHWYENREQVVITGAVPKGVPLGVESLVLANRNWM